MRKTHFNIRILSHILWYDGQDKSLQVLSTLTLKKAKQLLYKARMCF